MRVVLINPPLDSVLRNGHVSPVTSYLFYNSAPLGLLYIGAMLEASSHEVHCVDAAAGRLDVPATVRRVEELRPDIVGIGSFTVTFETTRELAQALKVAMPEVPVVLGSYHVSLVPHEAMRDEAFDVGVIGEGEFTMLDIVEAFRRGRPSQSDLERIQGICFRRPDGTVHLTPRRPAFKDLDRLPFPARHLLPPDLYRPIPIDDHAGPKFSMISSRGCPFGCVFCQKAGSGYRMHSPAYVVDEMEHLVRDFAAQDIAFVDSLFTANRKRVEGICDEILRRGVKVSWTCSSRVEIVDKPLLQRMHDAGCWRTRFGIESGSDRVLDFISKGITKDKIRRAVEAADEVGLRPKAFFMVGHMPDNEESILETIEFAKSLPLHDVTVQINTILPDTPQEAIWNREGAKWGRMVRTSTDEKSFWEPTYVPWGMEPEDLVRLHRKFYREFYLRPSVLSKHAASIRSVRDVRKYWQGTRLFAFLFFDHDGERKKAGESQAAANK